MLELEETLYGKQYKQMKISRRLTFRRQQDYNPRSGLYDEDPEVVKEICEHIIRHNNPTGLLHEAEKWTDPSALTDIDIERVTTTAFKSKKRWKNNSKGVTINSIKGRPFWLKRGNVGAEANNFQKVFQSFFSYQFKDRLTKPLIKPNPYNFNPMEKNPLAMSPILPKNQTFRIKFRRHSLSREKAKKAHQEMYKVQSSTMYTLKRSQQKTKSIRETRQTEEQELESKLECKVESSLDPIQECSRIVKTCTKILNPDRFRSRVHTVECQPAAPRSCSSSSTISLSL